jgi:hypothetical protein
MSYEYLDGLGDDPLTAFAAWGEIACRAAGGNWDAANGVCCPANESYGPGGCTAVPGILSPPSWQQSACQLFGGYWDEGAGACMYPPSSSSFVRASQGKCPADRVETPDGRCLPMLPTQVEFVDEGEQAATPEAASRSWWQSQPDSTKVLVVGGAAAAGLVLLSVAVGAIGSHYDKNAPSTRRRSRRARRRR